MANDGKTLTELLNRAKSGAYDPSEDGSIAEAERRASVRDRELKRYRDFYDDVKQHGGVKENAFQSEDW